MEENNVEIKNNTKIKRASRAAKKERDVKIVTLEFEKEDYISFQEISEFLYGIQIEPGQKGVIAKNTNIVKFLMGLYNNEIPINKTSKEFYRRCSIAKFLKVTTKNKASEIIQSLNSTKIEGKVLSSPEYILRGRKEFKKWNKKRFNDVFKKSYITNGLKELKSKNGDD